ADQALALIQRKRIEVAVLDISMPMLDGIQLLGMLHRRHPEIKKVILTSAPSEANRLQCLSAGAELFLEKPATADGFRFVFNVLQDLMNWRQAEGFCGTLQQVGLPDIIQIECLRRNSCILEVRDGQARGEIYIESGLIVHALTEALSGEKAFHALLSLNNGRFQLLPYQPPPRRSIQGSWEWLLMESARVRDEEKGSRSEDKTVLIQRSQADTHAKPASQADSQQEQTGQRKAEPEALSSNGVEVPDLGGEIVVISTYDGKWNPVKKPE
ncbi:MAG TPA: response regulator, partial [Verrucomicrobiae bacterium]|nr:response regulator [Verrucomicrobiae bacterium]